MRDPIRHLVEILFSCELKAVVDGAVFGGKHGEARFEVFGNHINIQSAFMLGIIIFFAEIRRFFYDIGRIHFAASSFPQRK